VFGETLRCEGNCRIAKRNEKSGSLTIVPTRRGELRMGFGTWECDIIFVVRLFLVDFFAQCVAS
jgi:hypothetical protein